MPDIKKLQLLGEFPSDNPEPIPPDWNAAEGEAGHILNKPFGIEITPDIVFTEEDIANATERIGAGVEAYIKASDRVLTVDEINRMSVIFRDDSVHDPITYTETIIDNSLHANMSMIWVDNGSKPIGVVVKQETQLTPDIVFSPGLWLFDYTGVRDMRILSVIIHGGETVYPIESKFLPTHLQFGDEEIREWDLPETTVYCKGQEGGMFAATFELIPGVEPGKRYIVSVDGTEYESVAVEVTSGVLLGNQMGKGGADNGEPYTIVVSEKEGKSGFVAVYDTVEQEHTISVSSVKVNTKPLDPKFLPETDTPDWNAAEGEVGHILNKPFYTEESELTLLSSTQLSLYTSQGSINMFIVQGDYSFEDGQNYRVVWNDTPYDCVAAELGGQVGIGNISFVTGSGDTGEPFIIAPDEAMLVIYGLDGNTSPVLEIIKHNKFVKQLEKQYLPEHSHSYISYKEFDGATPFLKTYNETGSWSSIAYGNGKFVIVSMRSHIAAAYTADDNIKWIESTGLSKRTWRSIAYGNGKFVAACDEGIVGVSENGIDWTEITLPFQYASGVSYGANMFVIVSGMGDLQVAYSEDGINWTTSYASQHFDVSSIAYGNGKFVAVGTSVDMSVGYSVDGINWNSGYLPHNNWESVTYGDGKFVAISYDSTAAAYSTDGINWVETNLPIAQDWSSVCYGNGVFVAIANYSSIGAYSKDGINWLPFDLPANSWWSDVDYGNGKFIVISSDSDYIHGAAYSIDGITWTTNLTYLEQDGMVITPDKIGLDRHKGPDETKIVNSVLAALPTWTGGGSY